MLKRLRRWLDRRRQAKAEEDRKVARLYLFAKLTGVTRVHRSERMKGWR